MIHPNELSKIYIVRTIHDEPTRYAMRGDGYIMTTECMHCATHVATKEEVEKLLVDTRRERPNHEWQDWTDSSRYWPEEFRRAP
jgi:hypothetical protein